jgi:S-adenosylmethionine:tRNA ribosyltransferase-isomerase
VLSADFVPRVIDGLLTGMHDPSESHFHLLRAFADEAVLLAAWRHAGAEATCSTSSATRPC